MSNRLFRVLLHRPDMPPRRLERIRRFFGFATGTASAGPDAHPDPAGADRHGAPEPECAFLLSPGELVAERYRITRVIGRGGMGEVYEAQDQLLNEAVALKTLRSELARDESLVKRFQKEIQLARKVTHPNVCRVFETGLPERAGPADSPLLFFTMELLSGETLRRRIRRAKRLSRAEAFPIAVQIAEGLQAAHEAGIVHADFKSGNVILTAGRRGVRAVITDFGLSRIDPTTAPAGETRTIYAGGRVEGTLAYMSPEQMSGGTITAASDIYSFGIVLFEMATGKLPFDDRRAIQAAMQRVSGEGIGARSLVPDLDPRWDTAIRRCLETDPERRFACAGDLADYLRAGTWRYWSRRDWVWRAAAVGVPVAAAGGYWFWASRPYRPRPAALDWYQKGVAALHSMTYEAARKALEQAVAADPGFALAHGSLARAYQELDYSELAKESMLRALALAQESPLSSQDGRRLRAWQHLVSREYDRALPLFQQMEDAAGPREKPAAALESGWLAELRDDTERAAAAYERALKLDPVYAAAKLRLGYIRGRRRQVDAAVKFFKEAEDLYRASSNYEGVTESLLQQAIALNRSGRAPEAMRIAEKALSVARAAGSTHQQIRLWLWEGVTARNLGDTNRAGALARQAIDAAINEKMDNLATTGLIDLANLYLVMRDPASAEPIFRRARDLAGRARVKRIEARALAALGSLCEQQRRPAEARQLIESAVLFYRQAGYRREFVQAMTILGGVHWQLAEFDQGVRVLREALSAVVKDPQNEGQIWERLAAIHRDQGAWAEALTDFERAAGLLGPAGGALARLNCAELYWRLGRRQDALRLLSEAEKQPERSRNRQFQSELRVKQARVAYQDGRMGDAAALSRLVPSGTPPVAQPSELGARLILALARIRDSPASANIAAAESVIEDFRQAGLLFETACARLDVAEALTVAARPSPAAKSAALKLALESLDFFAPRRIWESVWRGHWVAARAAEQPGDVESHKAAAREALARLKALWSADAVDGYLRRPDIGMLVSVMKL